MSSGKKVRPIVSGAFALALAVIVSPSVRAQSAKSSPGRPTAVSTRVLYSHVMPPVAAPDVPPGVKATGIVRVRVVVSETGETTSTEVVSGPEVLREPALDAVKSWTFVANEVRGAPTSMTGVVVLRFNGRSASIVGAKGEAVRATAFGRIVGGVPDAADRVDPGVPHGVPGGVPGSVEADGPADTSPAAEWNPPEDARRMSGESLAGKANVKSQPVYPKMARTAGVEGAVVVEVVVGEGGNVVMARAISGHPLLRDAAVAAARRWVFEPTQFQGQPVSVIGLITFNFKKG